jgi:hypothetical protein
MRARSGKGWRTSARGVAIGAVVAACASEIPSAAAPPSDTESNIPSGASGFAQQEAELGARRATALAEIGEARRAIKSGGDDCGTTCPLIIAFHAGVDHLCNIKEGREDLARCKEALADLVATEKQVKGACEGCKPVSDTNDYALDGGL